MCVFVFVFFFGGVGEGEHIINCTIKSINLVKGI